MREIKFSLETTDPEMVFELLGTDKVDLDSPVSVSIGTLACKRQTETKTFLGAEVLFEFALSIATGVTSGLIAAWLYDKLSGRTKNLRIGDESVQIDEEAIRRAVTEELDSRKT